MKSNIDNIKILHTIRFLSSLYFYHHIITLYLQARGLNYLQINSLWGVIVGVQALAEIPTGIIADKIGRKFSIIIALALQFIGECIFIFANCYLLFVLICVIAGIGFSFLSGCFEAMMYDSLKANNRQNEMQKVVGLNGSFALVATMTGASFGGLITADLQLPNFIYAIIATAVFVFLSLLAAFFLTEPSFENKRSEDSSLKLLKDGVNLIKTNRSLRKIIILSLLVTPFINYLLNFYPPYFVKANVPGFLFGATLAIASLTGALASKYAYLFEKIFGVRKGVMFAVILPGLFYFLLAAVSHPIISIILVVFAFSSMHFQKPIFLDYLNRHIESKNRATVLSLINVITGFYVAIMGLLIGLLADLSLSYAFIFMGILIAISAVFMKIDERHIAVPDAPDNGNET